MLKNLLRTLLEKWLAVLLLGACFALYATGFDIIPQGRYTMTMGDIAIDAGNVSGIMWRQ